jgi:pimeloyl-ACP methyl ester carboxylesterase
MNSFPQFITELDGLDIHFLHVRSKHEDALPLLVCHGWPGSVVEHLKIIEPLIDPTAHGASASDAFHLVVPSMPGYGYSGKPTSTGWGPDRNGRVYVELMRRLGYTRFAAQGGDWGGIVVDLLAAAAPPELAGIHTNMAGTVPPEIDVALFSGQPVPDDLSEEEKAACEQLGYVYKHLFYAFLMGDRPQSLTAIADSPVGLAVFLLGQDLFGTPAVRGDARSPDLISRAFAGQPGGLSRDDVLDSMTLFWLTNSAVSAARIYWENKFPFFAVKGVTVPTVVSVFPAELYQPPRSWAQQAYPNLVHYNRLPAGGHFAAWEQPKLFTEEVRADLRSLRL